MPPLLTQISSDLFATVIFVCPGNVGHGGGKNKVTHMLQELDLRL